MERPEKSIHIVGAGLAGSECAYQLAQRGHSVVLYEMRPESMTPAHKTGKYAELVCSNSLGSQTDYSAPGQLKWEAENRQSLILRCARRAGIPAGMALAVDRGVFSDLVTGEIHHHPRIFIRSQMISNLNEVPRPTVIATGPLTHPPLAKALKKHFDDEFLYFYDAIAPIVGTESINMNICWMGDRFGKGTDDYINCPLNKEQYVNLSREILAARKMEAKEFETPYFEACIPIEVMFERGEMTPRFGPMSPKGLPNPRTGQNEFAIVQLRQDNRQGTAYNMVGFQTKMAYGEQTRIFRMISGLEEAEFLKLGSIHRNLYIDSPRKLTPMLTSQKDPQLFFAGQITGVEGYFESTCMGLLVADFVDDFVNDRPFVPPVRATAMGSLYNAITEPKDNFQPTNINFGLFPAIPDEGMRGRRSREQRRKQQLINAKKATGVFS